MGKVLRFDFIYIFCILIRFVLFLFKIGLTCKNNNGNFNRSLLKIVEYKFDHNIR